MLTLWWWQATTFIFHPRSRYHWTAARRVTGIFSAEPDVDALLWGALELNWSRPDAGKHSSTVAHPEPASLQNGSLSDEVAPRSKRLFANVTVMKLRQKHWTILASCCLMTQLDVVLLESGWRAHGGAKKWHPSWMILVSCRLDGHNRRWDVWWRVHGDECIRADERRDVADDSADEVELGNSCPETLMQPPGRIWRYIVDETSGLYVQLLSWMPEKNTRSSSRWIWQRVVRVFGMRKAEGLWINERWNLLKGNKETNMRKKFLVCFPTFNHCDRSWMCRSEGAVRGRGKLLPALSQILRLTYHQALGKF